MSRDIGREFQEWAYPLKDLTEQIIAGAMTVHRTLGPGFIEIVYENALALEFRAAGHVVCRQVPFPVYYRDQVIGEHRADVLIDNEVVVELKSVEALMPVHQAQLRSTLKAARKRVGLLLNFNRAKLDDGIRRVIL